MSMHEIIALLAMSRDQYEPCMSLSVSLDGGSVELVLDTDRPAYSEWITGEGADICLLRCANTHKVIGCRLPLMTLKLAVFYDGPVKVNDGFLRQGATQ